MFLELQFTQDKFFEMLRDQVQRALPLVADEFDDPLGGGDQLMIDHLDVSGVTLDDTPAKSITIAGPNGPQTVNGNVVRVKIDLGASLTTRTKVKAAGHLGKPALQFFGLWVKADLSAKASGGQLVLNVKPVELGSVIDVLPAATKQQLLGKIPPLDRAIALPDVAGHAMTVHNAGMTLHAGTIAIRAELSNPTGGSAAAWTSFFAGGFTPKGGDWSLMLPKELLIDVVDDAVTEAVDQFPVKDPSIEIVKEPVTSWLLTGPVSTATINAVDACPVGASDIEMDLNFSVAFGLANGEITVTIDVTWDLNDWDVFRCAVATVLVPGAALTLIVGAIAGPIGAIIAAVATIIAFIVALVAISDQAHGQLSDGAAGVDPGDMGLHTVAQDDDHVVIAGHVSLGGLLPGMTTTAVVGTIEGLLLAGNLTVPAHQERGLVKVAQSGFDWGGGYSCSKHAWAPEQLPASVAMGDPSKVPVSVAVEDLTQPNTIYVEHAQAWMASMGGFSVEVTSTATDGTAPPCELLIRTNSGVRYANLGKLAAMPAPPPAQQMIEMKVACYKQRLPGPKQWLEALWLVDPPPYEAILDRLHVWEIAASKVRPGAQVELAIVGERAPGQARVVATVAADVRGQAAFRIATRRGEHIAVGVERGLASDALFVAGAVLEPVARLAPHTRAVDVALVGVGDATRVLIATRDQVLLFGLQGQALGRASVPRVQHVAAIGNRLTAHDGARVVTLRAAPESRVLTAERTWRADGEIARIDARGGGVGVTLRSGATVALDRHLAPTAAAAPVRAARWLAEPWLAAPIRVGNHVARIVDGAVVVYRYARTQVF